MKYPPPFLKAVLMCFLVYLGPKTDLGDYKRWEEPLSTHNTFWR
jgi:hypothetical protein